MKLSIIILNYNTGGLFKKCLLSIEKIKTDFKFEVVVVDNGSEDESCLMVKKDFPWVNLIENKKNLGFSKGNNIGIRRAKGKYILLLNSDTVVNKKAISEMVEFMEKNKKVGAATCRVLLEDGSLDPACHRGFPTPWNAFCYFLGLEKLFPKSKVFAGYHLGYLPMNKTHEIDSLTGAFYFVRKKVIDEVGLLDEDYFMYGEDLDWSYRIKKTGWKIMYVPKAEIVHFKKRSGRKAKNKKLRRKVSDYFYETMKLFYKKHYLDKYPKILLFFVFLTIDIKKIIARLSL